MSGRRAPTSCGHAGVRGWPLGHPKNRLVVSFEPRIVATPGVSKTAVVPPSKPEIDRILCSASIQGHFKENAPITVRAKQPVNEPNRAPQPRCPLRGTSPR